MGIDITTYRIRIGRFSPGRGYISTGIAGIYLSSITGSDIHYRMLSTMLTGSAVSTHDVTTGKDIVSLVSIGSLIFLT